MAARNVTGHVRLVKRDRGPKWYAKYRLPNGRQVQKMLGPVWTILYALLAVSAFLAWRDAHGSRRHPLLALYAANGALNLAWTYIFFQAKQPVVAGIEILLLLATIVAMAVLVRPFSRIAAATLVPYGAWVAYASSINWAIAVQN